MYHPGFTRKTHKQIRFFTTCPRPLRSLKYEEASHLSSLVAYLVAQEANTFPCDF